MIRNLAKRLSSTTAMVICCFILQSAIGSQPTSSSNPTQVIGTDNDLVQAIESTIGSGFLAASLGFSHYIPGYGLSITFEKVTRVPELNEAIEKISAVLLETGSTVEGLTKEEWLSIFFRANGVHNTYDLLIRMKQDQPDTLEVWVNGLPGN